MAGLPKKYAKMGFAKGWRAYRASKGKAKKKKSTSSPKKGKPMARRRSIRSRARRFIGRRKGVVPLADAITAVYVLDGMTDKRVGAAITNGVGAIAGTPGMSIENAGQHLVKGIDNVVKDPKKALVEGAKNGAFAFLLRKGLSIIGVPRTINFLGKKIQTR